MKVSISTAAKMVGIERSTLYRHIEEKSITVEDKDSKRPKIDVSELIRVYGDKVKTLDQIETGQDNKQTDKVSHQTASNTSIEDKIELEILKERLKNFEKLHETEKGRLEEQIEMLKSALESEKQEKRTATAFLTDQRQDKSKIEELEKTVQSLFEQKNQRFWQSIFRKKTA